MSLDISREALESRFRELGDEALLQRFASGDLTELAQDVVHQELLSRGLDIPAVAREPEAGSEDSFNGELTLLRNQLTGPTAHVLCAFLESEGIPASVEGLHWSTMYSLISYSTGGVRLMVHEGNLARARELLAAFDRGDFALDEDTRSPDA